MIKEYPEKQYVPTKDSQEYMRRLCKYLRQYDIDFLYENFWLAETTISTSTVDGSGYRSPKFNPDIALNTDDGHYKRTLVPYKADLKLNKTKAIKCGLCQFFEFLTPQRTIFFSSLWSHFLLCYFARLDRTTEGRVRLNVVLDTQKEMLRFSTVQYVVRITHYTEKEPQDRPKQPLEKPIRKVKR